MSDPLASIEVHDRGEELVIRIIGEVDLSNADELGEQIERRVTVRDPRRLTLDLADVEYIDSRGVLLLMRLSARLRDQAIGLRVLAPPDSVAGRLLAIAGLGELSCGRAAP
ncbi:MAG: STAS domain-containing protein [Solirubrobacteraceae bacterium]